MNLGDLKIDIYADGADVNGMLEMYKKKIVKGFTTNPTLMKKAGVVSYTEFAREVTSKITDYPVSFEVFSDEFDVMEKEAIALSKYGKNVFVKIPITNSGGDSSKALIKRLSQQGINLNITAVFTVEQVKGIMDVLDSASDVIISVFAGRIADAGIDPEGVMTIINELCHQKSGVRTLWASCREVYNIIQADRCRTDIITVTNDILKKMDNLGKDLDQFSLETVRMFADDSKKLGFSII